MVTLGEGGSVRVTAADAADTLVSSAVGGEEASGQWDDWLANRAMAGVVMAVPASGNNPLIGTQPRDLWSFQPWVVPPFRRPSVCVVRIITNEI